MTSFAVLRSAMADASLRIDAYLMLKLRSFVHRHNDVWSNVFGLRCLSSHASETTGLRNVLVSILQVYLVTAKPATVGPKASFPNGTDMPSTQTM